MTRPAASDRAVTLAAMDETIDRDTVARLAALLRRLDEEIERRLSGSMSTALTTQTRVHRDDDRAGALSAMLPR